MPRLSMWKENRHSNDYKFHDKRITEMFTVGGTGVNVYKYLGPSSSAKDGQEDPLGIDDFLFLENRDRKYEKDVYNIRGIYNIADTDFDLSQFGLFLQNDTLFITFHLNDMVEAIGRKLMSGDVLELPHLRDYYSLDTSVEQAISRYYVVQEGSRPTEGYSPTWWPHLWRVKVNPLVDSEEYSDILDQIAIDNSTGEENSEGNTLRDLLSTYQRELEISNQVVAEAEANVPESGYDTSKYYVVPADETGRPLEPVGLRADVATVTTDNTNYTADFTVSTPKNSETYSGYLVGDGLAPNGHPVSMETAFPSNPDEGDYVLRVDFMPNRLFRYNGSRWVSIEDDVRTPLTPGNGETLRDTFINNTNTTTVAGETQNERQALHKIFEATEDE